MLDHGFYIHCEPHMPSTLHHSLEAEPGVGTSIEDRFAIEGHRRVLREGCLLTSTAVRVG